MRISKLEKADRALVNKFFDTWFLQDNDLIYKDMIQELVILKLPLERLYTVFKQHDMGSNIREVNMKKEAVIGNLAHISDRWATPERISYMLSVINLKEKK